MQSHFFNRSGQFGSLDWLGEQVDEDPYRIVNDTTVCIGSPGVAFHYRILHGNTLMLTPVLTKAMAREALADPKEFSSAGWVVCRWPTRAIRGTASRAKAGANQAK